MCAEEHDGNVADKPVRPGAEPASRGRRHRKHRRLRAVKRRRRAQTRIRRINPAAWRKACAPPVPSPQRMRRAAMPAAKRKRGAQRPASGEHGKRRADRRATLPPRRVWPHHRRPERAEYRPSAAGRFRAEASALFWLKASSESGARGRPARKAGWTAFR